MTLENTQLEPRWAGLSGRILEGGYEVEELLEAQQDRAEFKIRVLGDRTLHAVVRVFSAEAKSRDDEAAIWETVRAIRHRNVSAPLATGKTNLDGAELIYAVLKRPEEILSGALRERALEPREAGDVLMSVSAALEQLLSKGLVHGCVSPEQIVASGDSVQVAVECARPVGTEPPLNVTKAQYLAPESTGANVTPAADIWCLGATLFEILKQKTYGEECASEVASLPAPFQRIVERCVVREPQARCDLAEALGLYKARATAAAAGAGAGASAAVAVPISPPSVGKIKPPAIPLVSKRNHQTQSKFWIYAAAAIIVFFVVIWAARPKQTNSRRENARTPTVIPTATAPSKGNAWETRTLPPEGSAPKAQPTVPAPKAEVTVTPRTNPREEPRTINGPVWRVILFTYSGESDAEKMAQTISKKHPDLQAEVFSPNGEAGPYLVTAGGGMSRDQAVRLRERLLSMGMPRDTYIQNYRQ